MKRVNRSGPSDPSLLLAGTYIYIYASSRASNRSRRRGSQPGWTPEIKSKVKRVSPSRLSDPSPPLAGTEIHTYVSSRASERSFHRFGSPPGWRPKKKKKKEKGMRRGWAQENSRPAIAVTVAGREIYTYVFSRASERSFHRRGSQPGWTPKTGQIKKECAAGEPN